MGTVGGFALSVSAVALALQLISILIVLPRLGRHRDPKKSPTPAPPRVTLLRPVRGLEHQVEATLASGLVLDYPNYETLFCVEDDDDPVIPLVRRLIDTHPDVDARLLIGRNPVSGNPKLNNLVKGWNAARGAWVAMADSNIMLPANYLSQLLARWDARTGLVSSPPAGVDPQGLGGALECAFLNSYQARWQLAADQLGLGFAQGKTLFWKHSFLNAAGGPAVLGAEMAEDVASTKLVRRAGLKVRLAQRPFEHPVGQRTLGGVWGRQLRWAKIRRLGFVGLFVAEPLTGAALPITFLLVGVFSLGLPVALILLYGVLWYGAEWVLARVAGWPASFGDTGANILRDALIPVLWIAAWRGDGFVWQGNQMTSDTGDGAGDDR